MKKYIKGDILEIGAGCGSFTRNYVKPDHKNITLTELDNKNILDLNQKFKNFKITFSAQRSFGSKRCYFGD